MVEISLDKKYIQDIIDQRVGEIFVKLADAMEDKLGTREAMLAVLEQIRYEGAKEDNKVEISGFDTVLDWDADKQFNFRKTDGYVPEMYERVNINEHILGGKVVQVEDDKFILEEAKTEALTPIVEHNWSDTALKIQELAGVHDPDWSNFTIGRG